MLPLDHFEGDAEVVEDGHGKIVEEGSCQLPVASSSVLQFSVLKFSVLSSQCSVLSSQKSETRGAECQHFGGINIAGSGLG